MRKVTTIIIGAGQSGLAMSQALTSHGIDHLVVDRGGVADAWQTQRWNSLCLLTPNWANGMPGRPYTGADSDGYMSVRDLVSTLAGYARHIDAPVQCDTAVHRVSRNDAGYRVETSQGPIQCRSVVLAAGACAQANVPAISSDMPEGIFQTTPSQYKKPDELPAGGVLVVGSSATGVQLAREVQNSGRQVTLAVGWHTRLPRTYRGRDIEGWLDVTGVLDDDIGDVDDLARARRTPSPQLIGGSQPVDLNALQECGVEPVGRLMDIRSGSALFSGGLANACASADLKMHRFLDRVDEWIAECGLEQDVQAPDRLAATRIPSEPALSRSLHDGTIRSVVWATGYRPDFGWLDVPVFDPRGRLQHHGGVVAAPGLYAMGLTFMRRRRSHQISGVGADARELSAHMRAYLDGRWELVA